MQITLIKTNSVYISQILLFFFILMEAHFCHIIKNKKVFIFFSQNERGNCDFLSHNSPLRSQLYFSKLQDKLAFLDKKLQLTFFYFLFRGGNGLP